MTVPANWTAFGTPQIFEQDATKQLSGTYSCHFKANASGAFISGIMSDVFNLVNGQQYRLRFWLDAPDAEIVVWVIGHGLETWFWLKPMTYPYLGMHEEILACEESGEYEFWVSGVSGAECWVDAVSLYEVTAEMSEMVYNLPPFGHGQFGHIPCGHGTVNIPLNEEM